MQVARELAAGGVLPRRRGTPGSKARHGQAVPTTSQAENTRCSNWVRAFQRQLPDLAQGKFVFTVEQPQTFDAFHPGARLVEDSDGRYSHVVVMDVPDLFGEVAEDVLVQSVRRAMHMRVRCGLPPSAWSVERAVRDDLAARVEAGRPLGRVERGWAGPGGELVDAMGGGQSHRPWVADMAREVGAGVSVDEPSPSRNPVARPLIGYPGWVADGKEYRFTSGGWGYVLMSREVDPSVSARVSLARGWLTQSRMAHTRVAAFRTTDLHGAVAEAILDVLDGPGAPYLSRSHVLTDLVDVQERGAGVSTVVTRQGLLVGLNAASARVRTATAHAHAVQEFAPVIDSPVAERAHARSVDMALADLQDAYEDEIRAQSALVDFDAPPRATPGPAQEPVPDAERVASVLARLARADVVERRIGHALRTVIRTLMITEVAEFSATGIVTLDVPQHEGEDIKVGPITFVVPLVMPRHVPGKARARSRARAFLTGTATMEQLKPYRARGQATRTLFKSMADALMDAGMDAGGAIAILRCPMPGTRALVAALTYPESGHDQVVTRTAPQAVLDARPPEQPDPPGPSNPPDPRFVELLRTAYLTDQSTRLRAYATQSPRLQDAVDALTRAECTLTLRALMGTLGAADERAWLWRDSLLNQHRHWLPPVRIDHEPGTSLQRAPVSTRACPHCQTGILDIVARVPEVPPGLLCSTCLRNPDPSSPVYPDWYRDLPTALRMADAQQPG